MSALYIVLCVIYVLGCFALIAAVLLQKKREGGGIGSVAGLGNVGTYWERNKGRSIEGALEKWSKIGGAVFFAASLIMCLL